jgi:hypothetical protein
MIPVAMIKRSSAPLPTPSVVLPQCTSCAASTRSTTDKARTTVKSPRRTARNMAGGECAGMTARPGSLYALSAMHMRHSGVCRRCSYIDSEGAEWNSAIRCRCRFQLSCTSAEMVSFEGSQMLAKLHIIEVVASSHAIEVQHCTVESHEALRYKVQHMYIALDCGAGSALRELSITSEPLTHRL